MEYYSGVKTNNYFEGWYFKFGNDENAFAIIPSIHYGVKGEKKAHIQYISKTISHIFTFDSFEFEAKKESLYIKINDNVFSTSGISLNLNDGEFELSGSIIFGEFNMLKKPIMGFFRKFKCLECYHEVISMEHTAIVDIIENGVKNKNNYKGYIEKDFGTSFPKKYLWLQANLFETGESLVVAIAHIPFLALSFTGLIAVLKTESKEYYFSTYNCAKIILAGANKVILKHKHYVLEVAITNTASNGLMAPKNGVMCLKVVESLGATASYNLYHKNNLIKSGTSTNAGFERYSNKKN